MSANIKRFQPSKKLQAKFNLWVILIFVFFVFPFVFMGFLPDLGWTYVWIFLLANLVWLVPCFALIPPYYRSIEYELGDEEIVLDMSAPWGIGGLDPRKHASAEVGRHNAELASKAIGEKARELLNSLPPEHRGFGIEKIEPGHWWLV